MITLTKMARGLKLGAGAARAGRPRRLRLAVPRRRVAVRIAAAGPERADLHRRRRRSGAWPAASSSATTRSTSPTTWPRSATARSTIRARPTCWCASTTASTTAASACARPASATAIRSIRRGTATGRWCTARRTARASAMSAATARGAGAGTTASSAAVDDVYSYTVYTSGIDMKIDDARSGQRLFEGKAQAVSTSNRLQYLVPNLVEAMFTGFPGNSGETRAHLDGAGRPARRAD